MTVRAVAIVLAFLIGFFAAFVFLILSEHHQINSALTRGPDKLKVLGYYGLTIASAAAPFLIWRRLLPEAASRARGIFAGVMLIVLLLDALYLWVWL